MAARALDESEIPFTIYNIEPGREVSQNDKSAQGFISDNLPYNTNIFCTTGIETARLAALYGSKLFDGRRSIGYWPWELPEFPLCWRHAYHLVDEIWASSRFTFEAFARSFNKPVRHMPMAVTVDSTEKLSRPDFGLPKDRFLFVCSFDFLSSLTRKNPQACVDAFRIAFPIGDEPVGLVIKAMRANNDNPVWQKILSVAETDDRIVIIDKTFERGALLDLYRACDCYVSLHRSEGFGRGMAEAMLLGKPVIATGYSGNLDFTVAGSSALVDWRPRSVSESDYPFGAGSSWAEPCVHHAASWMTRMSTDRRLRDRLAISGRMIVAAAHSPGIVGANYLLSLSPNPDRQIPAADIG